MQAATALALVVLLSLSGCVSASKYKAETQRAAQVEADLRGQVDAAQKREDGLKAQLKTAGEQIEAGLKTNKDLQQSLEANKGELQKKAAELIKERDALASKLAERDAEAAKLAEELKAAAAARAAELAKVQKNYEDLTASLKSEIAAGEIKITELKGKLTVNMVDRILFDSGHADVKAAGRKVLQKVGSILKDVRSKDIRIEGHSDNVPIGGELKSRYPSNWELSTARATAVARYLQDEAKIDARNLVAAGYGEYRPVAPNDTPENRALNRRIEIVLVPRD